LDGLNSKRVSEPFRICISASFTAEPLEAVLKFWGGQLAVDFDVRFAPFQQLIQTLLNPSGDFAANKGGVNVAMLRVSDLGDERAVENAAEVVSALRIAAARDACPMIFVLCPDESGQEAAEKVLRDSLDGRALEYTGIERLYPVASKFDRAADHLGAIPYTEEYFAALGTALARRIAAVSLVPFKVIAVDCDNTLWDGICGEDGPAGVTLGPGRRVLQEFLLQQREDGMLLALASKNNLGDVMETFLQHPEMPLQPEHFTAMQVNWNPKPGNLSALAGELGLGLDSLVFMDDSAKECAEMREEQPQILTLELRPDMLADPVRTEHFLAHVWALDHPVVTEEDRRRADSYEQAREFGQAFQSAHSLEEFMSGLDLQVEIKPVAEDQLPRVAQLTQRTNQFNFTTVRRTEAEIRALLDTQECLAVKVKDRFGDYGLTGAVIFATHSGALKIDSLMLSCRVLGRGVEHAVMAYLGNLPGVAFVEATLKPTNRNQPALQFLREIGAGYETDLTFRFPAAYLAALRWRPSAAVASAQKPVQTEQHRFLPFERIARELSTVEEIVAAMRGTRPVIDASLTATERELAAIWAELLKVPQVGPDDRFFDLGGHSLLAVLLISRVQEKMGVSLPVDDVYSGDITLRDLAMKIDAMSSGGMESAEYEAMLAEIESLSDEDVRALLGQQ
jgi:FkbH-like protein